jgi:hypothetical protein
MTYTQQMLANLEGEELFAALRANKKDLIASKKADTKYSDTLSANATIKPTVVTETTKDASSPLVGPNDTVEVTVVCNAAWWCDSHLDVLTNSAYDNSVIKRGNTIPHIADHNQVSTGHVGDVKSVYTKEIKLTELGLKYSRDSTTALVMETTIRKDYNEDVFKFYKNGKINQHSIGLRYINIQLCINSDNEYDKEEFALWNKYYPEVINKEIIDAKGYFWIVEEVDVMENSCVLFGANSLTPTLAVKTELPVKEVQKTLQQLSLTKTIGNSMDLQEALSKLVQVQSELETLKASSNLDITKAIFVERERTNKILDAKSTFGASDATVATAISKGWPLDIVTEMFTELKAQKDAALVIDTSGTSLGSQTPESIAALKDKNADKTLSFEDEVLKGIEEAGKTPAMFKGIG